jgi:hypothetical protein
MLLKQFANTEILRLPFHVVGNCYSAVIMFLVKSIATVADLLYLDGNICHGSLPMIVCVSFLSIC